MVTQSSEVEKYRCPICGHFPTTIIDTYKINTWVIAGRAPVGRGGVDWCEECCTCSPETVGRFYEDFLAECYALREQILARMKLNEP